MDRRSYLKLAGTAAGSAGLLSGTAAGFTRRGIQFDNTVDMVADAGCDPNGNEPCDAKIRDAADDYTLLKFPAGEYKLTEKNYIGDKTNVGFVGEGDVRFTVPSDLNRKVLVVDGGTGLLFENIDLDLRASGATPGLHFGADDNLEIHDVEYIGQGIHPNSDPRGNGDGNPQVTNAFSPIVRSESGTGRITNVVAKNDGLMGAYNSGEGRVGVWIGISHEGTIRLRNCQFEGFPNNGLYCSRTGGVVQVEGGVFRNNDITQVRLSSRDSYVENAIISADLDNSDSPNPNDALNTRGVRFEAGRYGFGGAEVRDCDVSIVSTTNSSGAVVVGSDGADHSVFGSRISVEEDKIRGFYAKAPTGFGNRNPPPEPHTATVRNTSVTGRSNGAEAVRIDQRDDSAVTGCCINQTGADRDGVKLYDSPNNVVKDSTIDVPGQQVLSPKSQVTTDNLTANGSCPVATQGAGAYLPRSLSIESNGGRFSYQFTVSDELGKSTARGATIDSNDTIIESTATGQGGGGGTDSYGFSGEILAFELSGDASVYLDGERVNPSSISGNRLTIEGAGSRADYTVAAGGALEKSTANGASINDGDDQWGSSVSGFVVGGRDSYAFSGGIAALQVDDSATVYRNGQRIEPDQYPDSVLTIEGHGSGTPYSVAANDILKKTTANDASINAKDDKIGTAASGFVIAGRDSYALSGGIKSLDIDGDAHVFLDGRRINPDEYPDSILTFDGNGSWTTYSFAVSDTVDEYRGINSSDSIWGASAGGGVGSGQDSYAIFGEITRLALDNDARVELDRSERTITIRGRGPWTPYSFRVSGSVTPVRVNDHEDIHDDGANGFVGGSRDVYRYSGELRSLVLDGAAITTE
ncbi:hypothetical protein C449_13932 [Halococcus saccharolyticus DSM 5350]|uniref:Right handed beta helix domain-containing protein n=1 Tax=Halococcus saccharolyticus DSM 5350 TaxID=1227455 RepID=M0MCM0_9EURY|nr:hypothetical protein C449_13932 [Halococcus saccharolyticus DSM 5350]